MNTQEMTLYVVKFQFSDGSKDEPYEGEGIVAVCTSLERAVNICKGYEPDGRLMDMEMALIKQHYIPDKPLETYVEWDDSFVTAKIFIESFVDGRIY